MAFPPHRRNASLERPCSSDLPFAAELRVRLGCAPLWSLELRRSSFRDRARANSQDPNFAQVGPNSADIAPNTLESEQAWGGSRPLSDRLPSPAPPLPPRAQPWQALATAPPSSPRDARALPPLTATRGRRNIKAQRCRGAGRSRDTETESTPSSRGTGWGARIHLEKCLAVRLP